MKLGERLRFLRKKNHLTLKALSQLADLSVPYLSDMERSVVNPSVETLQKVAKTYNMTVKDLFNGVEELGESAYTAYPEGFRSFLNEFESDYEIDDDWKELLMKINFRGKQPTSQTEWLELYLYLKRILSPKEEKVNDPKKHIIKLVQNTVKKYSSTEVPSFGEICAGLGLDVRETSLPLGIDGMHKGKTIFINSEIENEERKRFTQFHEVTHYLIEKEGDLISELHDATWNQDDGYERPLEQLCNIGAAEFLMPSKAFSKLYEERGFNVKLIPFAARYFKCSTIATTIQLAQVAPNSCITAVCESIPTDTIPSQTHFSNAKHHSTKQKLHVAYSASSPATKYLLVKYTAIPDDHLIHEASLQTQPVEGESYVPFRSGKKMPCYCEALADGDRIYTLFHLTPPPNPDQMTLI
ncbi:MAG: XRE family transcriptional regulator [Candidatus Poribacteria bacterium]|nr:XRE family transcriptional regulator [Candidatus Poribacteria bacterium]